MSDFGGMTYDELKARIVRELVARGADAEDAEITAGAILDLDNPPLYAEDFRTMRRGVPDLGGA